MRLEVPSPPPPLFCPPVGSSVVAAIPSERGATGGTVNPFSLCEVMAVDSSASSCCFGQRLVPSLRFGIHRAAFDRRFSSHWFSSGLPRRTRRYLPKRRCGIGSEARVLICSRIHDSGTPHSSANSAQLMILICGSACCSTSVSSPHHLDAAAIHKVLRASQRSVGIAWSTSD
jgi:hypothetical protein